MSELASANLAGRSALAAPQEDLFAPPREEELRGNLFAPPSEQELGVPNSPRSTAPYASPEELTSIAQARGVNLSDLEAVAPFYGVQMAGTSKLSPEYLAGFVSRGVGMNVPQFIYKKAQEPQMRQALDDLQKLADSRKSPLETGAELASAVASGLGVGRAVLGSAGPALKTAYELSSTVASPALQGAATSEEGQELKGAAEGALLGTGIGLAGVALGAGARKIFGTGERAAVEEGMEVSQGRDLVRKVEDSRAVDRPGDEAFLSTLDRATTVTPKEGERFGELVLPHQALGPKALDDYADGRGIPKSRAVAEYEQEVREFAKTVKSAKSSSVESGLPKLSAAKELIRDFKASQGPEELARRYDEYRVAKTAQKLFQESVDTKILERAGVSPIRQVLERLIDGAHAARAMDHRLGSSVEVTLNDLSRMNNRYTIDLKQAIDGINTLEDEFLKSGLTPDDLYRRLDTGDTKGLDARQFGVYEAFRTKYQQLGQLLRKRGVPLEMRANYVPRQMLPFVDSILRIESRLVGYKSQGLDVLKEGLDEETFQKLMSPRGGNKHFQETVRGIELLNHEPITSARELQEQARLAMNPATAGGRAELTAGAAMARQGAIPDFLLEKDPRRLIVNWAQENLKAANLQPGLSRLRQIRNVARAAGEKESAEYLSKLLTDITGRRSDTVASWINTQRDKFLLTAKRNLAKAPKGSLSESFWSTMSDSPEIMSSLFNQVYPNLLGLSPRAVTQNLMQPLLMTLPELGPKYGSGKLLRAYATFLANAPDVLKEAEQKGYIAAQWSTELRDALRAGVNRGVTSKLAGRGLDKWANFAMYAFEKSEAINRGTHFLLGKEVSRDILQGKPQVAKFLSSIPLETRREILAAKASGDAQRLEQLVIGYILNRTQFNYNRVTMNEFGRSMGPLFSTFTKWPASVAGDLYTTYLRKGTVGGSAEVMRRYIAPMLVAAAVSNLVFGPQESQSDAEQTAERLLFGKPQSDARRGLAASSPLGSAESVITGRVFKPPVVAAVTDPVVALVRADPEAFSKWLTNLYQVFMPVLPGAQKFFTETLPAISDVTLGTHHNPYAKED